MIVPNSNVYFAKCFTVDGVDMGVVKVGLSYRPEKRMAGVRTGQPFLCEVICSAPGDMFVEYFCHMWLNKDRVSGEFFRSSPTVMKLIEDVKKTGRLPFPIKFAGREGSFVDLDLQAYMERNSISFRDIEKSAGVSCHGYKKMLAERRCGNRRFLAALAVTAVRKGLTIHWARDFKPTPVSIVPTPIDEREGVAA